MYMRTSYFITCLAGLSLFLFLLPGCKSTKKVATVTGGGAAKAHAEFFEAMESRSLRFNTLSARMNAEVMFSGNGVSSRVDLKMIKDSVLVLSVQPFLGVELFRIQMTPDSIRVIDRMNQRYLAESYAGLKGQTPIAFNFYNLQALFINHIFLPGEQGIAGLYHRFQLKQEDGAAEIKARDSTGLLYTFTADGEEKLLSACLTNASENYALQWLYDDFRLTEKKSPFPMRMNVTLFADGDSQGSIKMNFSRLQTDTPVQTDTPIPEKYRRMTWADVSKLFHSPEK
jgi:hypothetical protein